MDKIQVVEFEIEMLDECVDLFIDVFSRAPWYDSYDSRDVVVNFFNNHYKNNYFLGYVATMNGKIVGASIGYTKPWINGMEYYIDEYFIDYNGQRTGVGTEFLKRIEEDLRIRNINALILLTEQDTPAHKFYMKNGFSALKNCIALVK